MTPPGTFDRVYAAIKQRLREGVYKPGARLEPAALSDELNASVTPVRDALHRLTGERLVEAPRHEGFRVPMLTETLLRQLYAWHHDLLLLAVMKHALSAIEAAPTTPADRAEPPYQRENELFLSLARRSGSSELVNALEGLTNRLEPVQRLEPMLIDETETESEEIARALRDRDRKSLRRWLARYHRRRERLVPRLLERLYQD